MCARCQICTAIDGQSSSHPTPYKHKDRPPGRLCTSSEKGTGASVWRSHPRLSAVPAPSLVWFEGKGGAQGRAKSAHVACGQGHDAHICFHQSPPALAHKSSQKKRRWCAARSGAATESRGQHRSRQISSRESHNEQDWIQPGSTNIS